MQILSNAVMDIHDGIAYPSCYENFKLSEAGSSNIPETTTSSFYMYDFGVVYLLDDHKRALSNSLQSYLNVSGMMPLIPDGDYQGHRSLVSSATCKSLSDLPESSSLITSMDPQAFSDTLIHERVEDGEYDCTSCQASFRSLAQLKVHRRAHQGERPFSCTLCHISFSTKQQLMGNPFFVETYFSWLHKLNDYCTRVHPTTTLFVLVFICFFLFFLSWTNI